MSKPEINIKYKLARKRYYSFKSWIQGQIFILFLISCFILAISCEDEMARPSSGPDVLFISSRIPNKSGFQLCTMNFDGTGQTVISDKIVRCAKPVCSNTRDRIAFTSYENHYYYLYIINTDGSKLVLLDSSDYYCGCPAWSPDDSKLLYVKASNRSGEENGIYLSDPDSKTITRLTDSNSDNCPDWFPGGNKFAFSSYNKSYSGIHVMNIDGSGRKLLTPPDSSFCYPKVSPDGMRIALVSADRGGSQIFIMNSDGSSLRQYTTTVDPDYWDIGFARKGNEDPVWSPKANLIAYVTWDRGNADICILNTQGSQRRITSSEANEKAPAWTPEGNFLLFHSNHDFPGQTDIYITSVMTSRMPGVIHNLSNFAGTDIYPICLK